MTLNIIIAALWIVVAVTIVVRQESPSWWITSLMAALLAAHELEEALG